MLYKLSASFIIMALLTGCQGEPPQSAESATLRLFEPQKSAKPETSAKAISKVLAQLSTNLPPHFSMDRLQEFLTQGDLKGASRYINLVLQGSLTNASLHLLNGLIYEEMANYGDPSRKELAGIAYRTAYTLDPSRWISAYLLGVYELRERRFEDAQKHLADALILRPEDPDILYSLAYTSYYLRDLPVAVASISKAVSLRPKDPNLNRAASIIYAAGAEFNKASQHLHTFKALMDKNNPDVAMVERRLEDWRHVHSQASRKTVADEDPASAEGLVSRAGESAQDYAAFLQKKRAALTGAAPRSNDTVILDCYILRFLEQNLTAKGQNIMEVLSVALGAAQAGGGTIGGIGADPIASVKRDLSRTTLTGAQNPVTGSWTKVFNYSVNPIVMAYSLNIANATSQTAEVLSRPSIATLVGRGAYFLDGDQYTSAAGGPTGAAVTSVDAGIKVEITPLEITPEGKVILDIYIAGSLFTGQPQLKKGITEQLVQTAKSRVTSTVRAHFGQTIMIGGASLSNNVNFTSGVPVLKDLPLIQYFFARQETASNVQSTLYLITPRRGGSVSESVQSLASPMPQASVMQQLQRRGLMAVGQYSSLYYILKYLSRAPLFADFRSGDLPKPGMSNAAPLDKRLSQLMRFLYF